MVIDPEYNNIIEQKMKDEVEELKKELAWDLEYSRLKIKKLKDYVKNELLIDHFVVKAFKNPQLKI
jgi:Flp pilus assembly CpaF family ATPase